MPHDSLPPHVPLQRLYDNLGQRRALGPRLVPRRFHRDDLRAVLRDYEDDNLPELDSCATSGCDQPAPFVLAHARPTCHDHAKD